MKRAIVCAMLCFFLISLAPAVALSAGEGTININTAPVEELVKLKRIGPSYAQRIVDYRKTQGPFKKPEDIMKVQGIGMKTLEANKDRIVCQ
ncbi:MAG: helix-hairpin-helix domain-containing protein [Deltaproteobacteria bacterium]|nr:helix-hairpin-helix domain-containing protein [Deltaproteobacteria bacterium]